MHLPKAASNTKVPPTARPARESSHPSQEIAKNLILTGALKPFQTRDNSSDSNQTLTTTTTSSPSRKNALTTHPKTPPSSKTKRTTQMVAKLTRASSAKSSARCLNSKRNINNRKSHSNSNILAAKSSNRFFDV